MTLAVAIKHRFGAFTLDVAFDAPAGITVLFGPSGSGKTTLVNAVAGLLRPDSGRIAADNWVLLDTGAGRFLPPHRRRLGYIFQEGRLFPHLSVRQNLLYGRWFAPRAEAGAEFDRVVELLGVGHLLDRRPAALSGGEKQRVGIGRALLAKPRLILADEPLAALDEARKAEILPYFERLRDEVSVPVLYVTHSTAEVARLATTVVALKQGQVAGIGTPSEVLGDAGAVGLREVASVLTGRITAHHPDGVTEVACPAGTLWLPAQALPPGTELRLKIPAQEVILARARPEGLSAQNILAGTVTGLVTGCAQGALVTLAVGGGQRLTARITHRAVAALDLAPGVDCHAIVKAMAAEPAGTHR